MDLHSDEDGDRLFALQLASWDPRPHELSRVIPVRQLVEAFQLAKRARVQD